MSTTQDPLVSVIIPVYNGQQYLAEAIRSALGQTYPHVEIIVIDDGSTDRSAEVAREFGSAVRYHFFAHAGLGAARNRGVELARGSLFAFLDADDLWVDEKLKLQIAVLFGQPDLDMVFGQAEQFHSPELDEAQRSNLQGHGEIMPGYFAGTLLIKREAFYRVGLFETTWRVGEFIDWYLKAIETGLKSQTLLDVLLKRRLHVSNMGIRERDARADYVRIVKASLDRRRGARRESTRE